jgi:hypothetical protein
MSKAGKKSGQPEKNCRIFQWLESESPDLAAAYQAVCGEGWLSARRSGVTFLYPEDEKLRTEIANLPYTNGDEAERVLKSLIIPQVLHTAADFAANKQNIGSLLGVKLAVTGTTAKGVTLEGGVKLELAASFKPLKSKEALLAVWKITEGRPPTSGEEFKATKKAAAATGGDGGARSARCALACKVERHFHECMVRDRCRAHNPYLAKVVSLLSFLKSQHPASFAAVQPMIDYDPAVTFYLLLEPYKTSGADFVLSDDILFGASGWHGAEVFGSAVTEYKEFFAAAGDAQALLYSNRAGVASAIDRVRRSVGTAGKLAVPQAVRAAYQLLASQNSVSGMAPVLPAAALAALPGFKKLWQDEVRHLLHACFQRLYSMPDYAAGGAGQREYEQTVNLLRFTWPGNDYASESSLTNLEKIKSLAVPDVEHTALVMFTFSSDFLYMPVPPGEVGAYTGPQKKFDLSVYNRNACALAALDRFSAMVNPSGIDPATVAALRIYLAVHGALPADIQAPRG